MWSLKTEIPPEKVNVGVAAAAAGLAASASVVLEASVELAAALCVDSIGAPSTAFTVTIEVEQGPGNPNDPNDVLADAEPKDLCRVTVRVPYNEVDYLVGHWLAGVNLTGVCTMRHE